MALGWTKEEHRAKALHSGKLAKLALDSAAKVKNCSVEQFEYYSAALHDYAIHGTHAAAADMFWSMGTGNRIEALGKKLKRCLARR